MIIAILAGIALNLLGARAFLYEAPLTGAVMASLGFLSNLTIPLILIIVGHGIRLNRAGLRDALLVIGVRMVVLLPLALILNAVLIRGLLHLEPIFEAAVFTLLILPPPFIIPLYMPAGQDDERAYVNNILTLYTVVSIIIFALYIAATA